MLVRAKEKGYYGMVLREPGQIFKLKPIDGVVKDFKTGKLTPKHFTVEQQFSENWMEKVNPKAPPPPPPKRGRIGARPPGEDSSETQKRIAAAEKLMENAESDQAEIDAEAEEIESAMGQEDAEVI